MAAFLFPAGAVHPRICPAEVGRGGVGLPVARRRPDAAAAAAAAGRRWTASSPPPPTPLPPPPSSPPAEAAGPAPAAGLPPPLPSDDIPSWAGSTLLSRAVTALIGISPVYALLAGMAKAVLVRTAEWRGIPWVATRDTILDAFGALGGGGGADGAAVAALAAVTDPAVEYPDYYLRPFHAYADGNQCCEAAAEAEPATLAVSVRTYSDERLSPAPAFDRLRAGAYETMVRALDGPGGVGTARTGLVVDVGCGVGLGTLALRSHLLGHRAATAADSSPAPPPPPPPPPPPDLQVVGVDLSPYMLAVATARAAAPSVTYRRGRAEALPVPPGTAGLVALLFLIHEMPAAAIAASFTGAYDALAPGGVLAVLDNDPAWPTLRHMPPTLFSLMKSTEPHSDEYYPFDVEAAAAAAGFGHVLTLAISGRHRTVTAVKPGLGEGV